MSKYPKNLENNIYPVNSLLVQHFLQAYYFDATLVGDKYSYFKKQDIEIKVPRNVTLMKDQVEELLTCTELTIQQFTEYVEAFKNNDKFDKLIDLSLKTPPYKKNKL